MKNISPTKKFDFVEEGQLFTVPFRNSRGEIIKRDTYRLEKKYPFLAMCVNINSGERRTFSIGDFECGIIKRKME